MSILTQSGHRWRVPTPSRERLGVVRYGVLSLGTAIRRRDFIKALASTSAAWPVLARAQQSDRMRRIGVLLGGSAADDPDFRARTDTLVQALQQLGWIEGRNLQIDYRSSAGDAERSRKFAAELVALNPDLIVATGVVGVTPLLQDHPHSADRVRECRRSRGRRAGG